MVPLVLGTVVSYFLYPVAASPVTAVATMKAPGSRAASSTSPCSAPPARPPLPLPLRPRTDIARKKCMEWWNLLLSARIDRAPPQLYIKQVKDYKSSRVHAAFGYTGPNLPAPHTDYKLRKGGNEAHQELSRNSTSPRAILVFDSSGHGRPSLSSSKDFTCHLSD